ncbi:hypothetical protein Pcinc_023333 [Petrolisthes cinctipes]|uniref:Protein transport protein Sec31A n=1 Tax=Petrolisthes cinctipes TaxID=88211 RepID=A0AAE1FDE1_PETCI|nr:hypothetical protein Pcinc_023333 [Petrolisthes cinctipes]
MKVKEVNTLANVAWSPETVHPGLLACGTTAKQLDAGLTTSASLTLYDLNLAQTNLELKQVASVDAPARFHALQWSGLGGEASGVIYGGCEDGGLYIYDAAKLQASSPNSLLGNTLGRHAGPIYTLSSNHLKANYVVCGSSDSEVTVWDVANLTTPVVPLKKLALGADVSCVEFNRQVEHIFSSTCGGHAVVWDLRKQASIMTISDTVSRMKSSCISWHPSVATQLVLASEEDATPWAQVWDLRYATAPLRTMEGHQRGILKTAWCTADPNLLITAAKDNKIYIWNPNEAQRGQEMVGEFPSYNQWSFDLDWCHRDPSLVAVASVDGCVSVYSLMGAGSPPTQSDRFSQIADSFPGMEMPAVVPQGATPQPIRLKNPPKWFPVTAGSSFAFGGRLISWNSQSRSVQVAQVVTEQGLVDRSSKLEEALSQPQFASYCQEKAQLATHPRDQVLWQYISANFEASPRAKYTELLGYTSTQVSARLHPQAPSTQDMEGVSAEVLADKMASLGTTASSTGSLDPSEQFEMIASGQSFDKTPETETAEGEGETDSSEPTPVTLDVIEEESESGHQGLITQALLIGDLESAVELCLSDRFYPHALALAAHAGADLFTKTRDSVLRGVGGGIGALVGAVVRGDLASIISTCKLASWKEALTAILTYSTDAQFSTLAESLGERLESQGDADALLSAMVCYVCAGSLDKFVSCWVKTNPDAHKPSDLQDLVEIIMGLQRSLSAAGRPTNLSEGSTVSSLLCQYASLLAAQGALNTAVSYLNSATKGEMVELRNRLYRALGYATGGSVPAASHQNTASSVRRTSTPHQPTFSQPQPTQFTPSVQDQQRSIYGEPVTLQSPSFYTPTAPHTQMVPQYGAPPAPMTPLNPLQPAAPAPPLMGPPPTQVMSGGFRRSGGSRYVQDPSRPSPASMLDPTLPAQPTPFPPLSTGAALNPTTTPVPAPPQFFTPAAPPSATPMYGDQQLATQSGLPSTKPPAAMDSSVPRGWNDPPPLSARKEYGGVGGAWFYGGHSGDKKLMMLKQAKQLQQQLQQQQSTEEVKAPEPIMCPVPGGAMPEPPQQFMGFQHPQYGTDASVGPTPGTTAPAAAANAAQPEPASKGPLPPEHQVIQDVLTEVKSRCLMVVQNQQMKQRLEDINTKLEVLYDKLRAGQLGPTSVSGVNRIISAVQSGDYRSALNVHAETIAKGSFSELSSFMPSLKLLLQYCMQLQVFLQ